nr:MAG TPA: hypothetical protein [Caudoviricetes sp.]
MGAESCARSHVQVAKTDCKCLFCCIVLTG